MSVLGNVSIRLTEEQGMLLDVARGFVRDQAPIEAVRAQLEPDTGFDATTWQAMVDMGWAGIARHRVGGLGASISGGSMRMRSTL